MVLLAGFSLRVLSLDERPMHTDEAVQGMIFVELLENGNYHYNPKKFHGPSLYFLTLPVAWVRGQNTAEALDELTLRLVPLFFSLILAASPLLLWRELRSAGVLAASGFLMLSPGLTYYGTYYIQEMVLVAGLGLLFGSAWRYWKNPSWRWASTAGLAFGLMVASKESAILYLLVIVVVGTIFFRRSREREAGESERKLSHLGIFIGTLGLCVVLFYSSFGRDFPGILNAFRGLYTYHAEPGHEKEWSYYLSLITGWNRRWPLFQGEGLLFIAATLAGLLIAVIRAKGETAILASYAFYSAFILLIILSAFPYKTPWLVLAVIPPLAILGGLGVRTLADSCKSRWVLILLPVLILGFGWGLFREAFWTTLEFPADERNPYAYVHTSPDLLELVNSLQILAADPSRPVIKVMAEEYWPVPWYLRNLEKVGYWNDLPDDPYAPIMIVSTELAEGLDPRRMEVYTMGFRGLRPGRILLLYENLNQALP